MGSSTFFEAENSAQKRLLPSRGYALLPKNEYPRLIRNGFWNFPVTVTIFFSKKMLIRNGLTTVTLQSNSVTFALFPASKKLQK